MSNFTKSSILKMLSMVLFVLIVAVHLIGFMDRRFVSVSDRTVTGEMDRLRRQREMYVAGLQDERVLRLQEQKPFAGQVLPGADTDKFPDVIGQLPVAKKERSFFDDRAQDGKRDQRTRTEPLHPQKGERVATHRELYQLTPPGYFAAREIAGVGFPPTGDPGPSYEASLYYPLQKRFAPVEVQSVYTADGMLLYGAGLCEEVHGEDVVLAPCIFREMLPWVGPGGSSLFAELAKGVQYTQSLAYTPWSRYATSYMGCAAGGQYRITVQFGDVPTERFVSVRVPFSSSKENALLDLDSVMRKPCMGLDLFFKPEYMLRMLRDMNENHLFTPRPASGRPVETEWHNLD